VAVEVKGAAVDALIVDALTVEEGTVVVEDATEIAAEGAIITTTMEDAADGAAVADGDGEALGIGEIPTTTTLTTTLTTTDHQLLAAEVRYNSTLVYNSKTLKHLSLKGF
jgi:hypothetical protein